MRLSRGIFRSRTAARRRRLAVPAVAGAFGVLSLLPASASSAHATRSAGQVAAPPPVTPAEASVDRYLNSVRDDAPALHRFFQEMPKGGDVHNHLSGAVTTEFLVELAAEDGLCVDTTTMKALEPPCGEGARPAAGARTDHAFRDAIVRAWSMQDFPPGGNGHDHFFGSFDKFGEVTWRHRGRLLADVADTAARNNQTYLETMVTPASDEARALAAEVGWDPDPARLHGELVAGGKLDKAVAAAGREADAADAEFRDTERCGTARARPGCRLTVRWIAQVSRGISPERVFTQMALGMRLAERDGRFVAINLVQPEDGEVALRDHTLQMRMVQYLRGVYPRAHVTLHAGELRPGLVKPEDLAFHIRQAVHVAGADRIGHGVDLVHEDDRQRTARTMAERGIAVEVPFTSNAQILGVRGAEHPFLTYRRYGVPVVLATDDPGVSRIDITHEYEYAARTYRLAYPELKNLARASLQYAFLTGRSLWQGNPTRDGYILTAACHDASPGAAKPRPACRHLLASSAKAALQWQQEAAFRHFEHTAGAGR